MDDGATIVEQKRYFVVCKKTALNQALQKLKILLDNKLKLPVVLELSDSRLNTTVYKKLSRLDNKCYKCIILKNIDPDSTDLAQTQKNVLVLLHDTWSDLLLCDENDEVLIGIVSFSIKSDSLNYKDVLKRKLPANVSVPTSFETVGHIIHLNLLPEHEPYKQVIAQTLLEKHKNIKTVISKIGEVSSVFRECPFELLAGEPNYLATVKENGFTFKVDYQRIYWSSKLSKERLYLTTVIPRDVIVYDVMCGVAGFGVYLASLNNCTVYCNDLNPATSDYIRKNGNINNVPNKLKVFCSDGRDFIRKALSNTLLGNNTDQSPVYSQATTNDCSDNNKLFKQEKKYFIMNLPKIAFEFLDAFESARNCEIFVYSFFNPNNHLDEIKKRQSLLNLNQHTTLTTVREVRSTSPSKSFYCLNYTIN